ncbi:hypothetical protein AB0M87_04900 [Streptomyces sp. NPDC051320]
MVFGLIGLACRKWPRSWQRALVSTGFGLTAVSAAATGRLLPRRR